MSVPHPDLLAGALCGDEIDEAQVIASNYFNQFSLPDSAFLNNGSLTSMFASFGVPSTLPPNGGPEAFQKQLWWYNGSFPKYMGIPRVLSEVPQDASTQFVSLVRQAIPMEERPCVPQQVAVGPIHVPTLFVCGANDISLLCNHSYAQNVGDLFPKASYDAVVYDCGHDFFLPGNCASNEESQQVMKRITDFVFATAKENTTTIPTTSSGIRTSQLEFGVVVSICSLFSLVLFIY